MPDANARIEQFRKMAHDDPGNELGHYSLGQECLRAGLYDDAIASLQRVIQLKSDMSRAYQLLATALIKKGQNQQAVEMLDKGVQVAHARGDIMPKKEMLQMLQELGAPVPELRAPTSEQKVGEGQVHCVRCHKIGPRIPEPPFRNAQGQIIQEKVCAACWREWVAMGTKVINELRLPMNDPQSHRIYDQYMEEFLNLK